MKIKEQGQILELDPDKKYWILIKVGSFLAKAARRGLLKKGKSGSIFFVGDMSEFMFIENSDRIKGIILKKDFEDTHDALADVRATRKCFYLLKEIL